MTSVTTSTVMLYATVDTFDIDSGAAALALAICEATGSALTGYLLNIDANAPPRHESRSLDQIRQDSALRVERNQANAADLLARAADRGVAARTVTTLDHSRGVIGCLADLARLHDLVVSGTDDTGVLNDRLVAEHLLFETGRPVLIAPSGWTGPFACRRLVAAWDNSRVAARALGDALALMRGVDEVVLLTIGGEKKIQSGLSSDDMREALELRGIAARVERRELDGRSIGQAIQDSARDLDADLLAMGGYGHSRLRHFILGGATVAVLANPQLPILLSH